MIRSSSSSQLSNQRSWESFPQLRKWSSPKCKGRPPKTYNILMQNIYENLPSKTNIHNVFNISLTLITCHFFISQNHVFLFSLGSESLILWRGSSGKWVVLHKSSSDSAPQTWGQLGDDLRLKVGPLQTHSQATATSDEFKPIYKLDQIHKMTRNNMFFGVPTTQRWHSGNLHIFWHRSIRCRSKTQSSTWNFVACSWVYAAANFSVDIPGRRTSWNSDCIGLGRPETHRPRKCGHQAPLPWEVWWICCCWSLDVFW